MEGITRRKFLQSAAYTTAGVLVANNVLALDVLLPVLDPLGDYPYRGWETLYTDQWEFDYFGRVAHSVNCTGSCTWKAYVKNGIAFKEEQFADYPQINDVLPVYNPRGCQKGANHKEYVYGPQRTKYPLIRKPGTPRGGGQWVRASWDEALSLIANKIVDTIDTPWKDSKGRKHRYSPDAVNFYAAIPAKHHITVAGGFRLANLIGGVACSFYDWYCDLPPGQPQTWAVQTDACESADWYNSSLIMLMGANLLETRIPDAHYFTEGRANGTKSIAVFPDYNATCTHADVFVPIAPGTDGALCLGMAKYAVDNNLHDVDYIKQFTDMPFLVREDTRKFLRKDGRERRDGSPRNPAGFNTYYVWDQTTNQAVEVPGTQGSGNQTLDLGEINPALEGSFIAKDPRSRRDVRVTTVFSRLREKLVPFTIPKVATITGLNQTLIEEIANDFATIKPARIIEGAGTNHYFHNDLTNRAQILLLALTGNVGKPGTGFDHYVGQEKIWPEEAWFHLAFPHGRPAQRFQNTTLWTFVHSDAVSDVDSLYPRPIKSYIRESVRKGWMPLWPEDTLAKNGRDPKVLFIWGANYVNQSKGYNDLVDNLLPKIDLIIDVNVRMDTSATFADIVLPAASMFEKWDLNTTDLHTYAIPFTPVIDLMYESRTDWQIWRSLAQALQDTGFQFEDRVPDGTKIHKDFSNLLAQYDTLNVATDGVPGNVGDDKAACQFILDNSVETKGMNLEPDIPRFASDADLLTVDDNSIVKHPIRFPATSEAWTTSLEEGKAYHTHGRMFDEKIPLGTMTGRQQFYIDHDWYLYEFGEELPTYKSDALDHVDKGYPLRWSTPHGRWSIHSTWRDAKFQLRLQRGRTVVYLNPADATVRGLKDNDLVEVFNDHGVVQVHLNISPRIQPAQAVMYHGWERYQSDTGWQAPTIIRINPSQLVGKYGQLTFRLNYWGPTGNQKDTRVDIRKVPTPYAL
ncbi:MAG: molybdopterin-dependent oxidoreductase [Desulfobulbaceae bacterium]|nr:molybdopterin-dependent oxidoreductase [Desulfobulbaceae bacterium]